MPFKHLDPSEYTLAMTGKVFEYLRRDKKVRANELPHILRKTQVMARMSPDQKAHLVEMLQASAGGEPNYVLMCGDGANDCAALKAADAGISLADSEASIAAPFSSKVQDISCVPLLLLEGRACLATTIQAFKFIELYAVTQFTSVTFLYFVGINLSDNQFLYIDLVVLFPLCIF